ncbi:MAG: UDP-N-acetylmuramoyl-tripeptide--D-alanyl-D-alanine ligase [Lachnospiraceae bacterium]|nr:UDP-N-acetylmuramoyl-tripeptide--D-alanyl-D-alanine ligase [Lachnospiraceae bacterium]
MIVRTILIAVVSAYALCLTLRHNMHMFQLNGYKNDEHLHWLQKNIRQQWLLYFGGVLAILRLLIPGGLGSVILDVLILLTLWLEILVYRAIHRLNNKKKLVYTARVKRMLVTIALLSLLLLAVTFICGSYTRLSASFMLLVSLQIVMTFAANIINHPIEKGIQNYYINDAKRMLAQRPDLKVIGVTGSYGKTSVKFYLQTLLQEKYQVLVTPGNFNTPLGVTRTVRDYLKPTHQIFICEMGARRVGEIKEVCDIAHPDLGIITAVGPQHLETFFSMENIQKTKFELADALPAGGMIFLNGDNSYIQEKAVNYPNKMFYYSEHSGEGYCAKDVTVSQLGTDFTLVTPDGESERFQMKLIGAHNVINVVGAIAVAHQLGMSLKELRVPVRRIQPVEHRMQMREQGLVTIIDDAYNSNPVGSKAAVETLAMFDGIRILITPGMVELGEKENDFNYQFGTYAADCCDYILLVGKKHTAPIREGVLSKGFPEEKCLVYDKLEEAVSYAYAIKGQGHKYILLENDLPDNY